MRWSPITCNANDSVEEDERTKEGLTAAHVCIDGEALNNIVSPYSGIPYLEWSIAHTVDLCS